MIEVKKSEGNQPPFGNVDDIFWEGSNIEGEPNHAHKP